MHEFNEYTCPHCFENGYNGGKCSNCGYDREKNKVDVNSLPLFTIIAGKYVLGHCIGSGGFGITYVAYDLSTEKRCAIKEFFPASIAYRDGGSGAVTCSKENESEYIHGSQRFYDEAKALATLKGQKNVVDIWAYMKANNTSYIVMEYVDGVNLKKYMHQNNRTFSYAEGKRVFFDVADALKMVHQKRLLHRDITPENILLKQDGSIKVVDFGSARDYIRNATGMSVMVKKGYAPIEQYSSEKRQGPYTDIYSLCCTIYFIISGVYVPDAFLRANGTVVPRLDTLVKEVPQRFGEVIEKGMDISPGKRYQSIDEMLNALDEPKQHFPEENGCAIKPKKAEIKVGGFWEKIMIFLGIEKRETKSIDSIGTFNPPPLPPQPGYKPIYLKIEEGPAKGFSFKIDRDGTFTVGRSCTQCNVVIDGNYPEISRLHCIIISQNHGTKLLVEDRSANGTYSSTYGRLEGNKQYSILPGETLYLATKQYKIRVVR